MPSGYYTGQCSSRFIFTMKDITIYFVDQARSLGILPKLLIWGTYSLISDSTFFFIVYLDLSY